jgi:hypothetical protein
MCRKLRRCSGSKRALIAAISQKILALGPPAPRVVSSPATQTAATRGAVTKVIPKVFGYC